MQTAFTIPGIHCRACAALIQSVSGGFPAITNVAVDLDAKTVTLDHTGAFDSDAWMREVESLGKTYEVRRS